MVTGVCRKASEALLRRAVVIDQAKLPELLCAARIAVTEREEILLLTDAGVPWGALVSVEDAGLLDYFNRNRVMKTQFLAAAELVSD